MNKKEHTIGLCLTDNNCDVGNKLTLELDVMSTAFKTHDIRLAQPNDKPSFFADSTDLFAAVDGNVLDIPTGSMLHVRLGAKDPNRNQDHASTYSVDRLVWCEEQSSARSEKGTIRGWFKYDVSDGNKRKVIPNASDAIVAMEQITKTDFYAEIKSNFKAYDVDLMEQGVGGSGSGSGAGSGKGKAAASTCRCRRVTRIESARAR